MIIIGEKINGTIPVVKKAIAERDVEFIQKRAIAQAEAGASFIDVCASVDSDKEKEVLNMAHQYRSRSHRCAVSNRQSERNALS